MALLIYSLIKLLLRITIKFLAKWIRYFIRLFIRTLITVSKYLYLKIRLYGSPVKIYIKIKIKIFLQILRKHWTAFFMWAHLKLLVLCNRTIILYLVLRLWYVLYVLCVFVPWIKLLWLRFKVFILSCLSSIKFCLHLLFWLSLGAIALLLFYVIGGLQKSIRFLWISFADYTGPFGHKVIRRVPFFLRFVMIILIALIITIVWPICFFLNFMIFSPLKTWVYIKRWAWQFKNYLKRKGRCVKVNTKKASIWIYQLVKYCFKAFWSWLIKTVKNGYINFWDYHGYWNIKSNKGESNKALVVKPDSITSLVVIKSETDDSFDEFSNKFKD